MEHAEAISARIKAFAERMAKLCEDPEYQRNAERIRLENAEAEKASREAERKLRLHACGVPRELWGLLDQPKDEAAIQAAREFLDGRHLFLTLSGPKGRGKTFALCWAIAQRGGRYLWAGDLVQAGIFDNVWKDLADVPVLALDELGAEYLNDAYLSSLYNLLDKRYANGRKTILATNLNGPGFKQRYCAAGMDRLYERLTVSGIFRPLDGPSLRSVPPSHFETEREPGEDDDS